LCNEREREREMIQVGAEMEEGGKGMEKLCVSSKAGFVYSSIERNEQGGREVRKKTQRGDGQRKRKKANLLLQLLILLS
jgi:hypothetical protein